MIRDRALAKKLDDDSDYFRKNYTVTEEELKAMRDRNMIRLYELGLHPFLATPSEIGQHAQHDRHQDEAVEDREVERDPAGRGPDPVHDPETDGQDHHDEHDRERDPAQAQQQAGAGRWCDQAEQFQAEQLAAARGLHSQALGGLLEVAAALRERARTSLLPRDFESPEHSEGPDEG